MATLSPNISITLSQQRLTCVLDPSLVLSNYGLSLTQQLGEVMDLWVVRELWHILDNTRFYVQQPESVLTRAASETTADIAPAARQEIIEALHVWEYTRMATDPISLNLFWIGDRPSESFLPRSADPQIRDRWESLTRSLDTCLNRNAVAGDILISAFRDTAALAVALRTAFILTYQPLQNNSTDRSPGICAALASWGIPCQQINPLDAIATIERDNLRRLIVQAGLSKLLWAGLHLVVLHLVMPSTFGLCDRIAPAPDNGSPDMHDHAEQAILTTNPWQEAQGFWYQI